jgi:hypothetical protein
MYAFTGHLSYLEISMRTADYYIEHLPDDGLAFSDFGAPYTPNVTPQKSSSATIATSDLLLLQAEINNSSSDCNNYRNTDAALPLLKSAVDLALAGEIGFGDFDASTANETLGAVTQISTPSNTSVSRGFESILMHGTANSNPHAGDGTSYGDYYLLEAGNRLLEMAS